MLRSILKSRETHILRVILDLNQHYRADFKAVLDILVWRRCFFMKKGGWITMALCVRCVNQECFRSLEVINLLSLLMSLNDWGLRLTSSFLFNEEEADYRKARWPDWQGSYMLYSSTSGLAVWWYPAPLKHNKQAELLSNPKSKPDWLKKHIGKTLMWEEKQLHGRWPWACMHGNFFKGWGGRLLPNLSWFIGRGYNVSH